MLYEKMNDVDPTAIGIETFLGRNHQQNASDFSFLGKITDDYPEQSNSDWDSKDCPKFLPLAGPEKWASPKADDYTLEPANERDCDAEPPVAG